MLLIMLISGFIADFGLLDGIVLVMRVEGVHLGSFWP